MMNGRMLKVMHYIQNKQATTFREISIDLDMKERLVRYDVDRVNDELSVRGLPTIEKQSKGQLVFPTSLSLDVFKEEEEFVYSQKERMAILLLLLLLKPWELRLNTLSKKFQVSRSTLKNDLSLLESKLECHGIVIFYDQHFALQGDEYDKVKLMIQVFMQYVDLLKGDVLASNVFEESILEMIDDSYNNISLKEVIRWIDDVLDSMQYLLTDNSYRWYVSNILILILYIVHQKSHPLEMTEINYVDLTIFDAPIKQLENIIKRNISLKKSKIIVRLLNYTNKYGRYEQDIDILQVETMTHKLITLLSNYTNIPFENDRILMTGLINHMTALLTRIKQGIRLVGDMTSILSTNDFMIFDCLSKAIKEIQILDTLDDDNEITYLAVHFIASIKRMRTAEYKKVLLVCGFGYGTTTMLKETLRNEFQITIIDTIPTYRLQSYQNWQDIDFVIATSKVTLPKNVKLVTVNPILNRHDFLHLDRFGIPRKKVVANYDSINKNLDFLTDEQRLKVLEVIRNELGYHPPKMPLKTKIKKLTDVLTFDDLLLSSKQLTWKEAVHLSASILENKACITKSYIDKIIKAMEKLDFYSVVDLNFALLHGQSDHTITTTGMSLLITNKPVRFGNKKTNLIFTLASKDQKEHIPAVITWVRMIKNTDIIERIVSCSTTQEAFTILLECERKVLSQ